MDAFLIIGLIVGIIMGLTGSGGALVAIPLLLWHGYSIKEASFLSLLVVFIAALINYISQIKLVNYRFALVMFSTSILGSYLGVFVKVVSPDWLISSLLVGIAFYSLIMMWLKSTSNSLQPANMASSWHLSLAGLFLGVLTTMTGLGGGVLLMPLLAGQFKMSTPHAVATSLLTIALSSLVSLLFQIKQGATLPDPTKILLMLLGLLMAVLMLSFLMKKITPSAQEMIRKVVFSLVVFFATYKIFF